MKTIINQYIGTYSPTGDTLAGVDWAYIFGGIILVLVFYFLLKIISYLFRK